MYSGILENLLNIHPIIPIIISLILYSGVIRVGEFIYRIRYLKEIFKNISEIRYQKGIIGFNIILIFTYPISLYNHNNIIFFKILSSTLLILGIQKIYFISKSIFNYISKKKIKFPIFKPYSSEVLVYLLLAAYFFICLFPISHADSVDYHLNLAKRFVTEDIFYMDIFDPLRILGGGGETLIAIGLVYNSDNFANFVQYAGLVSLFGIFKKLDSNKKNDSNLFYFLILISSPLLLHFLTSSKPQFLHIASNALSFLICFQIIKNIITNEKIIKISILLISILLINSVNAKYSFIIPVFLISNLLLFILIVKRKILSSLSILGLILIFYLPIIYWRYLNFGGDFLSYVLTPLPSHIPGYDEVREMINNYREGKLINIFTPFIDNFGLISNSFGISYLIILGSIFFIKDQYIKIFMIYCIFLTNILIYFLSGFAARFLLDPILWSLIIVSFYGIKINNFLANLIKIQGALIFTILLYFMSIFLPSLFSNNQKEIVFSKTINHYSLFEWASYHVSGDELVITNIRNNNFNKIKIYNISFLTRYLTNNSNEEKLIFYKDLEKKNPKYLLLNYSLFIEKKNNSQQVPDEYKKYPIPKKLYNCVKNLQIHEKKIGFYTSRNPYFNKKDWYDGYLYKLKDFKKTKCYE
tara:strand:+ start:2576 stop:4501 length:1926 start_codon:yes stop_codon:yes gene_type:complete